MTSSDDASASKSSLSAPMPGIIDKIFVNVGDEVQPGQSIAVIIAMKMEYVLKVNSIYSYQFERNFPHKALKQFKFQY